MTSLTTGVAAAPRTFDLKSRARTWSFWVVVVLLASALVALLLWPARFEGLSLDPDNPGEDGMKALAQVLGREGVNITTVRSLAAANELGAPSAPTTLVITDYFGIFRDIKVELLDELVSRYAHVVIMGADAMPTAVAHDFVVSYPQGLNIVGLRANCPDELVGQAHNVATRGYLMFRAQPNASPEARACFSVNGMGIMAHTELSNGTVVDVVGDTYLFSNRSILSGDAAALGLTLMGRHPQLVWLSVDPNSAPELENQASEGEDFLPPWFDSVSGLLVWTALVAMIWRGRRLGRLVIEPLPVVIKAIETTWSRGRIYHKTHASELSLQALQRATIRRLAQRLALPATAALTQISDAAATAAHQDPSQVWDLLTAPAQSEQDLVARAQRLATLEKEVQLR